MRVTVGLKTPWIKATTANWVTRMTNALEARMVAMLKKMVTTTNL
jgi:hypothetical protein